MAEPLELAPTGQAADRARSASGPLQPCNLQIDTPVGVRPRRKPASPYSLIPVPGRPAMVGHCRLRRLMVRGHEESPPASASGSGSSV